MSKANNLVTKPYLKQVLKKELGLTKKELRAEIAASNKDLHIEMRGIAAQLQHDITSDIKEQMRQDKADILGAVADFGLAHPKLYA